MIEEVKKILEKHDGVVVIETDVGNIRGVVEDAYEEVAQQVCQLFPRSPDNPDGYELKPELVPEGAMPIMQRDKDGNEWLVGYWASEPKPDEGRFITEDDLPWLYGFTVTEGNIYSILEAQDAKTASIKDAECQERVGGIFKWVEDHSHVNDYGDWLFSIDKEWQEFKEKEG